MQEITIEGPRELEGTVAALLSLTEGPRLGNLLCNDTAPNFQAVMVLINQCRELLSTIEAEALKHVRDEREWHRAALDGIEALGVV